MSKPASGTTLNTSHSLYSGLVHAWALLEGSGTTIKDSVTGTNTTISSSLWGTDVNGPILVNPGTIQLCASSAIPTTDCSVVVGYRKRDRTFRTSGGFGISDGTAAYRCGVHFPWNDGIVYWDFGNDTNGSGRLQVGNTPPSTNMQTWVFTAGSTGMTISRAGVLQATQSGHATRTSSGTWGIGQHGGQSADQYDIAFIYVYNRVLSSTEITSLNSNPYQMFTGGGAGYVLPIMDFIEVSSIADSNDGWYFDYASNGKEGVDGTTHYPTDASDYSNGYIYAYSDGQSVTYNMTSVTGASNLSKVTIWLFAYNYTYPPDETVTVDLFINGAWQGEQVVPADYGWLPVEFTGTFSSTTGVKVRVKYNDPYGYGDGATIYRVYGEITYNPSPATAVTLVGPTGGPTLVASTNFTAGVNGTITSNVVVTPAATGGGTFSPTSVTLTPTVPVATFTYTPATAGSKVISVTNGSSLTNPTSITYVATDPSGTVSFLSTDTATKGSWIGLYGTEGYKIAYDATSLPSWVTSVTFANLNNESYWASGVTDVQALQTFSSSNRIASYWYANTQFTCTVVTTGGDHTLRLYFLDWDPAGRTANIKIYDTNNNSLLYSGTMANYGLGTYFNFKVSGTIKIELTATASNVVMSALMFDPPPGPATSYTVTGPSSGTISTPKTYTFSIPAPSTSNPNIVITPASNKSGTWSPTTVTLNDSTKTATATFTPTVVGLHGLTFTNNQGLTNAAGLSLNVPGIVAGAGFVQSKKSFSGQLLSRPTFPNNKNSRSYSGPVTTSPATTRPAARSYDFSGPMDVSISGTYTPDTSMLYFLVL